MKLEEAKQKFVEAWGILGTNWGINRTMAQINALLLVSNESLSTDQIMEALDISRGNTHMNLRALIDWGLAERRLKTGERMEFFTGEKDIWKVAVKIIRERRKREIDPLRVTLKDLKLIDDKEKHPAQYKAFITMVEDIDRFAEALDKMSDKLTMSDQNWFFTVLMKLIVK